VDSGTVNLPYVNGQVSSGSTSEGFVGTLKLIAKIGRVYFQFSS
jgi:hypothetical protein